MAATVENGMEMSPLDFEDQADFVGNWFLMGKPYIPFLVTPAYLLFVLRIGPAYMKNRSPIDLKSVLLVYNAAQVVMSAFLFYLGVKHISKYGIFHTECLFENEEIRNEILAGCYWYVIAKITELLDTIFFVLRKKQNQVTFLHVYHHTFVLVLSWIWLKYGKTDDNVFMGTLNSFVHIWMYGYYALSTFPALTKYLWWKKHLTAMQLIQFVLIMIHFPINYFTSNCPPSILMIIICTLSGSFFFYLFSDFYKNSYGKTKVEPKSSEKNKRTSENSDKGYPIFFLNGY